MRLLGSGGMGSMAARGRVPAPVVAGAELGQFPVAAKVAGELFPALMRPKAIEGRNQENLARHGIARLKGRRLAAAAVLGAAVVLKAVAQAATMDRNCPVAVSALLWGAVVVAGAG